MPTEKPGSRFIIASTNYGGARTMLGADGHPVSRPASLARLLLAPGAPDPAFSLPSVAVIQEMTRMIDPPGDSPEELLHQLKSTHPMLFYVPTVSTDWYPLPTKWTGGWNQSTRRMEQGMTTVALREAALYDPELKPHHTGLVLNLPIIEFLPDPPSELSHRGLTHEIVLPETGTRFRYRHTRYRGGRDTEPRVATAHRVRLLQAPNQEFILLNVHLGTLKAENRPDRLRVERCPTPQAVCLRRLQLDVLLQFIEEVYRELKLPVVVAGDFNATPDSPELTWFCEEAGLEMRFTSPLKQCWNCAQPPNPDRPVQLHSHPDVSSVLTRTAEEFKIATGLDPEPVTVSEWCGHCQSPLFTHKRNFGLIDNLLYTRSSICAERNLRACVRPLPEHGIRLDTSFSDHLPVWSAFTFQE